MMDHNELANNIINSLMNVDKHSDAMTKLLNTIKKYLEDKCIPLYSWKAVNPKGDLDPMESFECKVTSIPNPNVDLSASKSASQALTLLGSILTSWISSFNVTSKVPTLVVESPINLICSINLTVSNADNQKDAMIQLATDIISGIKQCTQCKGTNNNAFTGTGTFNKFN